MNFSVFERIKVKVKVICGVNLRCYGTIIMDIQNRVGFICLLSGVKLFDF